MAPVCSQSGLRLFAASAHVRNWQDQPSVAGVVVGSAVLHARDLRRMHHNVTPLDLQRAVPSIVLFVDRRDGLKC